MNPTFTPSSWASLREMSASEMREVIQELAYLRDHYHAMRARAVGAENQLRCLKSILESVEKQLTSARKHYQHVVIPDAQTEDVQPMARQSDFHCICGTVCLTDGTGHWCNEPKCQYYRAVHSNKLG